jgi:hypothetical protein
MIVACPRCGNPRADTRQFCPSCGFDFGTAQAGQPAAQQGQPPPPPVAAPAYAPPPQPPPPPVAAPAYAPPPQPSQTSYGQGPAGYWAAGQPGNCPRCGAPIYSGYWQCGNCGLDLRGLSGVPPVPAYGAPAPRKASLLPVAVAGVLVLVLAGAGALYMTRSNGGTGSSPTPTITASALASATPAPTVVTSATPRATTTAAVDGTLEPPPVGEWLTFTAPDGTWSAKFPGTTPPIKQTQDVGVGTTTKQAIFYYSLDIESMGVYAVYVLEMDQDMSVMTSSGMLDFLASYMQTYLTSSLGGTMVSSKQTTLAGQPALEFVVDASGDEMTFAITGAGKRIYMVMTAAPEGGTVYPGYFIENFSLE